MDRSSLVLVGVIASAHGVKGQVKIKFFHDRPDELLARNQFSDATGRRIFRLKKQGVKDNLFIASINGVEDRNAAEILKGTQLYSAPSKAEKGKPNQWSYKELLGLEARLENGKAYGRVINIYNFGAGDIIELQLQDGQTEMLPFAHAFTGAVHPDKGYLIVSPPDYVETEEEPETEQKP